MEYGIQGHSDHNTGLSKVGKDISGEGGKLSEIFLVLETYFADQPWRGPCRQSFYCHWFQNNNIEGTGAKSRPVKLDHVSL